jgi:hypothetical protein
VLLHSSWQEDALALQETVNLQLSLTMHQNKQLENRVHSASKQSAASSPYHIPMCDCCCANHSHAAGRQVKRMDMEARSLAPDKGRPLLNKVREYKADLTSLREQLKQAAAGEATWTGSSNAAAAAAAACREQSCTSAHMCTM